MGLANAGTDPRSLVESLRGYGYSVFEVAEGPTCTPLTSISALVDRLSGEEDYTNILLVRSNALPGWLNGEA